jgi:hypothetical protein
LDADRFDQLAVAVSHAAPSRRSLLRRIAGGGVATALAALGISGFGEEYAAAKSCEKRCKQKAKKHDWSGGTGGGGGGTGGGGGGTGGGGGGGLLGLGGICVLDTECLSAFCNNTVLDVNGKGRCDSCTTVLCGAPNQRRCCGLVQICGPLNVCINL